VVLYQGSLMTVKPKTAPDAELLPEGVLPAGGVNVLCPRWGRDEVDLLRPLLLQHGASAFPAQIRERMRARLAQVGGRLNNGDVLALALYATRLLVEHQVADGDDTEVGE
jgi:hypothetical protein